MLKKYFIEISQDDDEKSINRINKKRKYLIHKNKAEIRIKSINKKIRILKNKIKVYDKKIKLCKKNYRIDRNNLAKIDFIFIGSALNYILKKTSLNNDSSKNKEELYNEFVEDVSAIDSESEKIKFRIEKRKAVEIDALKEYFILNRQLEMYKYHLNVLKEYLKLMNQRILDINNEEIDSTHQLDIISTQYLSNNKEEKTCSKVKIKCKK